MMRQVAAFLAFLVIWLCGRVLWFMIECSVPFVQLGQSVVKLIQERKS